MFTIALVFLLLTLNERHALSWTYYSSTCQARNQHLKNVKANTIIKNAATSAAERIAGHNVIDSDESFVDCLMTHLKGQMSRCRFADGLAIISRESSSEREVQFSGTASPGDELVFISIEEFITEVQGKETSVGKALESFLSKNPHVHALVAEAISSIYIAILLSLSRKETRQRNREALDFLSSRYSSYFDTLPSRQDLSHIPVFWSNKVIQSLQNSHIKVGIQERLRRWKAEFNIICTAAQTDNVDFVDFDTYIWARSIICSRAFDMPAESGGVCLVPFIDMLNHHVKSSYNPSNIVVLEEKLGSTTLRPVPARKCDWHLDENGFFLTVPFPENDSLRSSLSNEKWKWNGEGNPIPIEISYGSHSNAQLLMNYGFAVLEDSSQTILEQGVVSISLDQEDNSLIGENELVELKKELWERDCMGNCYKEAREIWINIGGTGAAESLLSMCRVSSCQTRKELSVMKKLFTRRKEKSSLTESGLVPTLAATVSRQPFSLSNEINAMGRLQSVTFDALKMYDTSLSYDDSVLSARYEKPKNSWWTFFNGFVKFRRNTSDENNIRNAIITRRGEKQVLQHYFNLACMCLSYLTSEEVDFEGYKNMLHDQLSSEEVLLAQGLETLMTIT